MYVFSRTKTFKLCLGTRFLHDPRYLHDHWFIKSNFLLGYKYEKEKDQRHFILFLLRVFN